MGDAQTGFTLARAKFSEPEASNHAPSLVAFTTITPELKFSVHTGGAGHSAAAQLLGGR
jgi:hypothetical protein